ncbi:MAG: UDP-N-acetylmuramoyl-tripeptide--D-alanyl-D-alanine ligase [bacterium]
MRQFRLGELADAMNGKLIGGDPNSIVTNFAIDSREAATGSLFFALTGERTDGHNYLPQVMAGGAVGAVVHRQQKGDLLPQILVDDTRLAMGRMAKWYRKQFDVKVLGVTGSTGKTSAKEMLAAALGVQYSVLKNEGNLNTEVGLPLTLMGLEKEHEVAVLEMAMRGKGQIEWLVEVSQPQLGLITNIGISHMELLGSRDGIAEAKSELLQALPADGIAILPRDDDYFEFMRKLAPSEVITFGIHPEADVRVMEANLTDEGETECRFSLKGKRFYLLLPVLGKHHAMNAAAALAGAIALKVDPEPALDGLKDVRLPAMRMEVLRGNGLILILDAYNANPQSMNAALQTLGEMSHGRRTIAILGDMAELGSLSEQGHREVGQTVAQVLPDQLITLGSKAKLIAEVAKENGYPSSKIILTDELTETSQAVEVLAQENDLILIKGSRVLEMERIAEQLLGQKISSKGEAL